MKQFTKLSTILTIVCVFLCINLFGQGILGIYSAPVSPNTHTGTETAYAPASSQSVMAKNALTAAPLNYKFFTPPYKNTSAQAVAANAGYENHPETGLLFPGTPCDNCYELIGKRTETTKTFEKPGANPEDGKDIMVETSTMPMHYRDAAGNFLTIRTQLEPDKTRKGVYAATAQAVPVIINAADKFSSLGKSGENIKFNNNLELIYLKPDGTEVSLGNANWANHTAGDEGAYVTNAWQGIDIEMHVMRGAVKTNFVINHAMPAYADGKLLIRDHLQMDKGLSLNTGGKTKLADFIEIRNKVGTIQYFISLATAYEKANYKNTIQALEYYIGANNTVDIALPGDYLNRSASAYPVIIDPLVSSTPGSSTTVNGCSYNALWTAGMGCSYMNAAATPPNSTITDIQFSFEYTAPAAGQEYAGFSFYLGTCRNPSSAATALSWSCMTPFAGTCTSTGGAAYSIFAAAAGGITGLGPCVPAPQCPSYNLNIQMLFYQNWAVTGACATTYYYGSQPLIIIVFGHTVELTAAGVTGTPATICSGATATLAATGTYGVPPYTYSWLPGPVTGSPATVSPTATTTYTLTVTDACGITTGGNTTITVNPTNPITGTLSMCIGNTTTLSDATAGGTWSSSTAAVATVGAATGIVNGVSTGTATITYTTGTGCKAYAVVTVTPLPVAITGTDSMCQGATTTLADATPGGAWSSSSTAIATVNASGVVTGVAAGTATITYGTPGCIATIPVLVNPTPGISSTAFTNPTVCNGSDGTITLSGLVAGATYVVHYIAPTAPVTISLTADATGNVIVTGLSAGTFTGITVTNSSGCVSNIAGPITLTTAGVPPAPIVTNNSPICAGGTVTFTATDTYAGVTYSWSGPAGFTSTSQNPILNTTGMSGIYVYTIIVTTPLGCISLPATDTVVVNPVPVIALASPVNPTTCGGIDGSITIVSSILGSIHYHVNYSDNGAPYATSITSDAAGNIVIIGLSAGTYDGIYITSPAGCVSNTIGPKTLTDPGAPPAPILTNNEPLCVGQTIYLTAIDSVQGGFYTWTSPNGGTSTMPNLTIINATYADSGIYTVSYNIANCISQSSEDISLHPPVMFTNITANTAIQYGSHIQLNVDGALYYWWSPDNGTLNNPDINNPVATPLDSTVYMVIGSSQWGCRDTTEITITIINPSPIVIPTAFTPNGDGLNDIFRLGNLTYQKLVDFSVFNRWGQLVYHNSYDPKQGWDGTFNGVPQDMGVYNYSIILSNADGTNKIYKGDVTLIR